MFGVLKVQHPSSTSSHRTLAKSAKHTQRRSRLECAACRYRKRRCTGEPSGCDSCISTMSQCLYPKQYKGRKASSSPCTPDDVSESIVVTDTQKSIQLPLTERTADGDVLLSQIKRSDQSDQPLSSSPTDGLSWLALNPSDPTVQMALQSSNITSNKIELGVGVVLSNKSKSANTSVASFPDAGETQDLNCGDTIVVASSYFPEAGDTQDPNGGETIVVADNYNSSRSDSEGTTVPYSDMLPTSDCGDALAASLCLDGSIPPFEFSKSGTISSSELEASSREELPHGTLAASARSDPCNETHQPNGMPSSFPNNNGFPQAEETMHKIIGFTTTRTQCNCLRNLSHCLELFSATFTNIEAISVMAILGFLRANISATAVTSRCGQCIGNTCIETLLALTMRNLSIIYSQLVESYVVKAHGKSQLTQEHSSGFKMRKLTHGYVESDLTQLFGNTMGTVDDLWLLSCRKESKDIYLQFLRMTLTTQLTETLQCLSTVSNRLCSPVAPVFLLLDSHQRLSVAKLALEAIPADVLDVFH